jgi:hypothetical protein
MTDLSRWRGLTALIADTVEHGASAIERVHLATARRPFWLLEQIPGIAEPAKGIHAVHDMIASGIYQQVRFVSRVAGEVIDAALEVFDDGSNAGAVVHRSS